MTDENRCCDLGFLVKTSRGRTLFVRPQVDLQSAVKLINRLGGPSHERALRQHRLRQRTLLRTVSQTCICAYYPRASYTRQCRAGKSGRFDNSSVLSRTGYLGVDGLSWSRERFLIFVIIGAPTLDVHMGQILI
jgi:hypothetical protein